MLILKDPIILALMILVVICLVVTLRPHRRPELLLLILTVMLFALPRAGMVIRRVSIPVPIPLAHLLVAVILIEWLLLRLSHYPQRGRFDRYFILYAVIAVFGLAIGLSTGGKNSVALLELCFYLFSMGIFFYACDIFKERRHFFLFARSLMVISVLVSIYGIAQKYFGSSILIENVTYNSAGELARSYVEHSDVVGRRVLSSYGDPNVLASQLIVFIGITLALLTGRTVPSHIRLVALAVLFINVICIVSTGSRAGMICLLMVAVIVLSWRSRWYLLLIPVLVIGAFLILPEILAQNMAVQFKGLVSSSDVRTQFPAMAWKMLQTTPFGCGFGNRLAPQLEGMQWSFSVVQAGGIWGGFNSFWLNLFSRLGLPGLISFALLLAVLFRYVWQQAKTIWDPQVRAILIGTLAGFVGQWIIWLANNTYMLPGGGLNFWFTMGMIVAGCRAFATPGYPVALPTTLPIYPGKQTVPV